MGVLERISISPPDLVRQPWHKFHAGTWCDFVDVLGFIQANYSPYDGGHALLAGPTPRTFSLRHQMEALLKAESAKGGVFEIDTAHVSGINTAPSGHLDREQEIIVGIQTDAPLKRSVNPYGGVRMAEQACAAYGCTMDPRMVDIFSRYRVTHNEGVFRLYTKEMRAARKIGIITGLPDAYGRGRIIGDYRRVALCGVDALIAAREADLRKLGDTPMLSDSMQILEELYE